MAVLRLYTLIASSIAIRVCFCDGLAAVLHVAKPLRLEDAALYGALIAVFNGRYAASCSAGLADYCVAHCTPRRQRLPENVTEMESEAHLSELPVVQVPCCMLI